MTRYLVVKDAEPESYGEGYVSDLPFLAGEEHLLAETASAKIKLREIPDGEEESQVREIISREHIRHVEKDGTAEIPSGEIGTDAAGNISTRQAEAMVGIDALHDIGLEGEGAEITIRDTGIHPNLYERYKDSIASLVNYTNDPDAYDRTNLHGSWIFSVLRAAAPGAKFHIHKVLSSETGRGSYSWLIPSVDEDVSDVGCSSLSGGKSEALNATYDESDLRGVLQSVAAGNDQKGTSEYTADKLSPGTAPTSMTVAAKRSDRRNAGFSSWGNCVEYAAPGMYIECADPDIVPNYWSGTSMAVYGVAIAAILKGAGFSKVEVKKAMYSTATNLAEPPHKEGVGMLNGEAAYKKLKGDDEPKEEPSSMDNLLVIQGKGDVVEYSAYFESEAKFTERANGSIQGNDTATENEDGTYTASGSVSGGRDVIEFNGDRVVFNKTEGQLRASVHYGR